jgi:hypothetical protein
MFVIVDMQTIFFTLFVGMLVVYINTMFHMANSSGSLVITVRLKAECGICMVSMLFYALQKLS